MSRPGTGSRVTRWLPWGDAASLILFTVLGLRFHNIALTAYGVLQTALPLVGAWMVFARVLNMYGRSGVWRFVVTWILAVPAGLAVRQVWLQRPFGPGFLVFLAVGGGLTLVFLGVWRAAAAVFGRVRPV